MSDSPTSEFDPAFDPTAGFDEPSWPGPDDTDLDPPGTTPTWPDAGPPAADDGMDGCCVPLDRPMSTLPGAELWAPNGSLVLNVEGTTYDVGIPTLDFDGDGRPDSTLVAGEHGQLYLVCDVTGDSLADGLLIADQDGTVLSGFEIVDGAVVAVSVPPGAHLSLDGPDLTTTDASVDPDATVAPSPVPSVTAQTVSFHTGTEVIDLGPATHDLDGDGILESVVVPSVDGQPGYVISELPTGSDGLIILDPVSGEVVNSFVSDDGRIREGIDVLGEPSDVPPEEASTDSQETPADQIGVAPDPSAPVPQTDPFADGSTSTIPSSSTTAGPEMIAAPNTADLSIPGVALVQHGVQGMYDVASQVWFGLTGGEPYPRTDDGTPFDPGQVFGLLQDRPETSMEDKDQLRDMQDRWDSMVKTTIAGIPTG